MSEVLLGACLADSALQLMSRLILRNSGYLFCLSFSCFGGDPPFPGRLLHKGPPAFPRVTFTFARKPTLSEIRHHPRSPPIIPDLMRVHPAFCSDAVRKGNLDLFMKKTLNLDGLEEALRQGLDG